MKLPKPASVGILASLIFSYLQITSLDPEEGRSISKRQKNHLDNEKLNWKKFIIAFVLSVIGWIIFGLVNTDSRMSSMSLIVIGGCLPKFTSPISRFIEKCFRKSQENQLESKEFNWVKFLILIVLLMTGFYCFGCFDTDSHLFQVSWIVIGECLPRVVSAIWSLIETYCSKQKSKIGTCDESECLLAAAS